MNAIYHLLLLARVIVEAHVKILEATRSLTQRQTAFVTQDILSEILNLYGEVEYRRHAVSTYLLPFSPDAIQMRPGITNWVRKRA